jgi:hypothetical protein
MFPQLCSHEVRSFRAKYKKGVGKLFFFFSVFSIEWEVYPLSVCASMELIKVLIQRGESSAAYGSFLYASWVHIYSIKSLSKEVTVT